MRFDIYTLQLLIAVMEEGSIAAAAEREHIAPSALSKRISELERSLGMPLFIRRARGIEPTDVARALARRARTILHDVEDMNAELLEFSTGIRGHVRMIANLSSITQFLPKELKQFMCRHPNVHIDLEERVSTLVTRAVAENSADIGIFTQSNEDHELMVFPYHKDSLVMIVPEDHPLAGEKSVAFIDTLDFEHVGMHRGSAANFLLDREANAANRTLKLHYQVTSYDAMVSMVKASFGVGVLPLKSIKLYKEEGIQVVPLADAWATRQLKLCVSSVNILSASTKMLLDHLIAAASEVNSTPE